MKLKWKIAQFLEKRWWKWYLSGKEVKTYLQWKKDYWIDFLQKIDLQVPAGSRVLDAGCGPAGIFTVLGHCEVDALDPLLEYYHQLDHFSADWYPYTQFISKSFESFHQDNPYDFVYCLNVINHVSCLQTSINKLYEFTKPGGLVVLSVDVHRSTFIKKIFQIIPGDLMHPQQYDLKDYHRFLSEAGFIELRSVLLKEDVLFSYQVFLLKKQ